MTTQHLYTNCTDISLDQTTTINITNHDGATKGLKLANNLLKSSATEIDNVCDTSQRIVNLTDATLTMSQAVHGGRILTVNKADGTAITLPAASGSGAWFRIVIGTAITSNSTTIKVANSSDTMIGTMVIVKGSDNTNFSITVGSTDDTITLNGTTTGGVKGGYIELIDIATNTWFVQGRVNGSGTLATNMSATV